MAWIQPQGLIDFINMYLAAISAETGVLVDTRIGSLLRAMANASSTNDMFLQTLAQELRLNTRLLTSDDDAADTFVAQFSPPFTPRISARSAYQGPFSPTALAAPATAGYMLLGSIQGILLTQTLSIVLAAYNATAVVGSVQPVTTLTSPAAQGVTSLAVASTAAMFQNATLQLTDGNYTATVLVQNVLSGTSATISPLSSALGHTFNPATTTVTMLNVVGVTSYTFGAGTVLANLTTGAAVAPTSLVQGVCFTRNHPDASTPAIPANNGLQPGYQAQTVTGSVTFEVMADTTNPAYDPVSGTYRIPANVGQIFVKAQAVVVGSGGNVAANAISVMPSPLPGIDSVTNLFAFSNGTDKEVTPALIQRFQAFMSAQGSSNKPALLNALASVATNLQYSLLENVAVDGVTPQAGHFLAIVGDTTGLLTATTLTAVRTALDAARPFTSTFDVVPPTVNMPTFAFTLTYDVSDGTTTVAAVQQVAQLAVYNYFAQTAAGFVINFNDVLALLTQQAHVLDVSYMTINGNGFDRRGGGFVLVGTGPQNTLTGPLVLVRPPLANIVVS
jgi:hypothetical protein